MPKKTIPMNFIKQTTLIFASILLVFSSCSKDDKAPEIAFNEPSMDLYGIADTVPLKLHIEDDEELQSVAIQITNDENADVISMEWSHIHKSHLMIDTFFVAHLDTALSVTDMCNYYILVEAKDTAGNSEEEKESVHIMEGTMEGHDNHSETDSGMGDHMDGNMGDHMEDHSGM